jgi:predicted DNA-binding transcriptional regulator YafY
MHHLLSSLDQGGLIGPHIAPLLARLDAIIGTGEASAREVRKRIRLLSFGSRKLPLEHFSLVGSALIKRRRLKMEYYARSTNAHSARECRRSVVHYRGSDLDNGATRNASGSSMHRRPEIVDTPARSRRRCWTTIFSTATASCAAARAARVALSVERARLPQVWHPTRGQLTPRRYLLELPFRDDRELVLDILRHGADVEVLAPIALRRKVRAVHAAAAQLNA